MASSGKKGKKTKGKTLALNDFLQETPGATPTLPIRKTNINWADEVEDVCDQYDSRPKANVVLPTAPKASRGFDEFSEKIPQQPPYIAYLSNLPYDVNEEEISEFFGDLKIQHMRIPKEDRPGEAPRLKGFGYVEFEDRESLVGALSITDCTLKNRRIRIEIATNLDNDRRRGGRMDNNRDRMDRAETSGDWRSGPRVEPTEPERSRGGGGFSRDRDRDNAPFERDRGSDRGADRGGSWRDSSDRPSFRDTDRGGDRGGFFRGDSDRGGGFSRDRDGPRDGFGERGRFSDREGDKRSFGPRRSDRDDREFTRGGGRDDARIETSEPRTRPKLVLAPRSKPAMAESDQEAPPPEIIPTSVPAASSSSIFGNAKPVDTAARERQIEDKLAKETEKTGNDSSRISRRDNDRRDWGRKEEDVKTQDRRQDSPRRGSPRRYSPRRSSPEYSPSRNRNYDRRGDSPDDRKVSPDRRSSPRRASPYRRGSAEYRRNSPDRRSSPEPRRGSPDRRRASPEQRRGSPDRRWGSPQRRRDSPERRRPSPDYRKGSPDRRRRSPDHTPITRGAPQRKSDDKDKRGPPKSERPPQKSDKDKPRRDDKISRDNHDREMPKLKEPEPPNFAVSNKYAFLEPEEDSD